MLNLLCLSNRWKLNQHLNTRLKCYLQSQERGLDERGDHSGNGLTLPHHHQIPDHADEQEKAEPGKENQDHWTRRRATSEQKTSTNLPE